MKEKEERAKEGKKLGRRTECKEMRGEMMNGGREGGGEAQGKCGEWRKKERESTGGE